MSKIVRLPYGKMALRVRIPFQNIQVIEPHDLPGLKNEKAAFFASLAKPISSKPLAELVGAQDTVVVVVPDHTRPFPFKKITAWLLEALHFLPRKNITILLGNGSHRATTPAEIRAMFGKRLARTLRILNHDSFNNKELEAAGRSKDGTLVKLNRHYVEADKRIIMGFIEPHFIAGFSGGYKAVIPGIAGIDTINHYHRAEMIGHRQSTWGVIKGNPTQDQIREKGSLVPVDFCVNLTLNSKRQITRFFCGSVIAAHDAGCDFARKTAMVGCSKPFDLVITTNSGYPLDQNFYQGIKGVSAAANICRRGGVILSAAECSDGFPNGSHFHQQITAPSFPGVFLKKLMARRKTQCEQWNTQVLAQILSQARVCLKSKIAPDMVKAARLEPVVNLDTWLLDEMHRLGPNTRIAVLPEGPMTIPYIRKLRRNPK